MRYLDDTSSRFAGTRTVVVSEARARRGPLNVVQIEYAENVYVGNAPAEAAPPPPPPPAPPPSPRDAVPIDDGRRPFDPQAARAALSRIDVSPCADEAGAPRGYGHAKVTFNPDGSVSKVVIDEPKGLSDAAVECIGNRLGTATVPAFEGNLVVMGTSWYVH